MAVGTPGEGRGQGYLFLLLWEGGICPGADDVFRATLPNRIRWNPGKSWDVATEQVREPPEAGEEIYLV